MVIPVAFSLASAFKPFLYPFPGATACSINSPSLGSLRIQCRRRIGTASLPSPLQFGEDVLQKDAFDPDIPLEEAVTPPSSWYTDPLFLKLELDRVFYRGWQVAGYIEQVARPHDFFTASMHRGVESADGHHISTMHTLAFSWQGGKKLGMRGVDHAKMGPSDSGITLGIMNHKLGSIEFVVSRDTNGDLHAFHNVCRHHASLLAAGCGSKSCFVCPYHGWTYGLDGALLKATRISGIKFFNLHEYGLLPINIATWGPFVLVNLDKQFRSREDYSVQTVENEWIGNCSELLIDGGINLSLRHVCRREYHINCNWKVFCDNYLDGGYHVPYAHGSLAAGLNLETYSTTLHEKVSIQRCEGVQSKQGDDIERLGSRAFYAFIYPNFMINRYGPWMDTNLVIPTGPSKCQVVFDYFLEPGWKGHETFIAESLEDSERVQLEDIVLCEGVQKGLESPAYSTGRYAPKVESAMHHFHCLLYQSLTACLVFVFMTQHSFGWWLYC